MKNSLLLTVCLSLILPFLANAKEAVSSISVKKSEVSAEGNNRLKRNGAYALLDQTSKMKANNLKLWIFALISKQNTIYYQVCF